MDLQVPMLMSGCSEQLLRSGRPRRSIRHRSPFGWRCGMNVPCLPVGSDRPPIVHQPNASSMPCRPMSTMRALLPKIGYSRSHPRCVAAM